MTSRWGPPPHSSVADKLQQLPLNTSLTRTGRLTSMCMNVVVLHLFQISPVNWPPPDCRSPHLVRFCPPCGQNSASRWLMAGIIVKINNSSLCGDPQEPPPPPRPLWNSDVWSSQRTDISVLNLILPLSWMDLSFDCSVALEDGLWHFACYLLPAAQQVAPRHSWNMQNTTCSCRSLTVKSATELMLGLTDVFLTEAAAQPVWNTVNVHNSLLLLSW